MTLKLYHAEPVANSLKSLIPLHEKQLSFESVYVDLHKFEQHEPWFVAINPEGQVPVLDHDGVIVTHTTVINEYLEDAFPDTPPLRKNPVFLYYEDRFQKPAPFRPDVAIGIDDVFDLKIAALDAHVSQVYEWLPWVDGKLAGVPAGAAERKELVDDACAKKAVAELTKD